ncbi:RHS repeat domain-containing protein [Victivallis sp. Marseille-Q1083]|uniref:RHS repeat domain-containing protein n=1 Tax=Victivallis sp. Marseille-Q1083 TaxID=2717288 RepID=UPI00158AA843|nr:RHS repeat-associated core domain-containing protein [Victivallis sp. Marseille-Q1083]
MLKILNGIYTKELNRVYTNSGLKGSYSGLNIGTVNLYTYGYDQYSRLNKVTTAAGVFNYTFLADSDLIASMTRPNNASTNYTYETARDLLTKVANGSISTFQYNNDALGRRTSMNRSGSAFTAADVLSYTYNSYSELIGASSNNNASYSYSYTYDPIGNRKTASLAGTNWTYTANNLNQYSALNQAGTIQNPTYDADGNMLTRDGWTQTWNAENRMIKAEKGTAKLEFAYDYMGRRIEKKVYNGSTLTSHIRFVYDGYKLIEELNGLNNNAILRRYVWQPVMLDSPLTVFDAAANKTYFYHTDGNKNITDITDLSGISVAHYEYSPYGHLIKSSGTYAITNVLTWSSEYLDRENNLIYYNFREYDPKIGRWLSKDPIGINDRINVLSFVRNDPVSSYDINGRKQKFVFETRSEPPEHTSPIYHLQPIAVTITLFSPENDSILSDEDKMSINPGNNANIENISGYVAQPSETSCCCSDGSQGKPVLMQLKQNGKGEWEVDSYEEEQITGGYWLT